MFRKSIEAVALFSLGTAASTSPAYPGDYCCTLYSEEYYEGQSDTFCISEKIETYEWDLADYGFGDTMSSYACGKNVTYEFCLNSNDNCGGELDQAMSGSGTINNFSVTSQTNKANLLILTLYDPEELRAVTVFTDKDCAGISGNFPENEDPTQWLTYYSPMMEKLNIAVGTASSVMIPPGIFIWYTKNKSQYNRIDGSDVWLDEETQSMECINLPDDWDDAMDAITLFDNDYF